MTIKAYANLYGKHGVGNCIGHLYPTRKDADASRSPSAIGCKEIILHGDNPRSIVIPADIWTLAEAAAKREGQDAATFILDSLALMMKECAA